MSVEGKVTRGHVPYGRSSPCTWGLLGLRPHLLPLDLQADGRRETHNPREGQAPRQSSHCPQLRHGHTTAPTQASEPQRAALPTPPT